MTVERRAWQLSCCALAAIGLLQIPAAKSAEPTIKSITFVSGFAPGGGDGQGGGGRAGGSISLRPKPVYDLTARLYVRHFSRFLPGNPEVKLQHMPGAGSLRAAQWLLRQTDGKRIPNGQTIYLGLFSGQALRELMFDQRAKRAGKLTAIGGRAWGEYLCAARQQQQKNPLRKPLNFGATAPRERSFIHTRAYSAMEPARIRIIPGYSNTAQIALAYRRREIDGFCGIAVSEIKSQLGDQMQTGGLQPLVRFAPDRAGALTQVPRAYSWYAKQNSSRSNSAAAGALKLLEAQGAVETSLVARPKLPAGHTKALRIAFSAMLADRRFRRDAVRWGLTIDPVPAAAIDQTMTLLANAKPEEIAVIRRWSVP